MCIALLREGHRERGKEGESEEGRQLERQAEEDFSSGYVTQGTA